MNECAVIACPNEGRLQICLFDGKYHRHGLTHYQNFEEQTGLTFRQGGWHRMCNEHQEQIVKRLAARD